MIASCKGLDMRFNFNKLGPIHEGEIELANLTVLCGKNNTGKTYITNSIYSYLTKWKELIDWSLPEILEKELYENAVASIDLNEFIVTKLDSLTKKSAENLRNRLGNYFACSDTIFEETNFEINIKLKDEWIEREYDNDFRSSSGKVFLSIKKPSNSTIAEIISTEVDGAPPLYILDDVISQTLISIVLSTNIPTTFIASAERTGASIFKNELNFNKNQLVRMLTEMDSSPASKFHPYDLVRKFKRNYAISVEDNVEFIANLPDLIQSSSQTSFINNNPHLVRKFEEISGGKYQINKEGNLYFIPTASKRSKLGLGESSSAVRSLMIIWYWLNYKSNVNDLLMVDEPELNLHPENQRKFAQFIAELVNAGIKVFMTTHSDYIIRELNTLILLNSDKNHVKKVMEKFGYNENDVLDGKNINIYYTSTGLFQVNANSKKKRLGCIEKLDITENGIKIISFDEEIRAMNKIQDALIYGL